MVFRLNEGREKNKESTKGKRGGICLTTKDEEIYIDRNEGNLDVVEN